MMVEQELELQYLEHQHSRAYHTGVIDGLGQALFAIDPNAAKRFPISFAWFDEEVETPRISTRLREKVQEAQREYMFDRQHSSLFSSVEAE